MAASEYAPVPVAVSSFLIAIATLGLILRFLSRCLSRAGFWWDDWLAFAAWPFSLAVNLILLISAFHGFGHHGGNTTPFEHAVYFDEIFYNVGTMLARISVLCFYYRIFTRSRGFTLALYITGGFIIVSWIPFQIVYIFQCTPIYAAWRPHTDGHCIDSFPFYLVQAGVNTLLDFVLLALPLKIVWELRMRMVQRLALTAVFVLGYLNPLISVLRMTAFIRLERNPKIDANYTSVPTALWSAAELTTAIFSCSIPSLTYLFRRIVGISKRKINKAREMGDDQSSIETKSPTVVVHDLTSISDISYAFRGDESRRVSASRSVTVSSETAVDDVESSRPTNHIQVQREFDVRVYQTP